MKQSFAPVVKRAAPAVINVYVSRKVKQVVSPFADDPFFSRLFGDNFGIPRERIQNSLGSGVLVSPDGLAVTNNHVIQGSGEAEITVASVRRTRVSGQGHPQGREERPRGASPRCHGRRISVHRVQRFGQSRSRRPRARHRRSVRRRTDGDERHRLGARPHASRHLRLSVLHSDRRRHQSRQFRRRAGRHGRPPRRHQHRHLLQERRVARHRICDSFQHGAARGSGGVARRHGASALVRRLAAACDAGPCRVARARPARRRA